MGIETAFLVIAGLGAAVSAVGIGTSYNAAKSAAADNNRLALLNAQAQTLAARQQGQLSTLQAQVNQTLANKDAEAAEASARMLQRQAGMDTRAAQLNIQSTREEFARALAAQRVQAAKAGVSDTTGSPLDLLTRTAEEEQRRADAIRYDDEVNRRGLFQAADESNVQAQLFRIGALGAASQGAAGRAAAANAIGQSKLDLYSARAQSTAMRNQATGNLIAGLGGLTTQVAGLWKATPYSGGGKAPGASYNASNQFIG